VSPKISIIIPVLNEVHHLQKTFTNLLQVADIEAIVADGGSQDGTVALAKSLGVKVITGDRGRAKQMNAGADVASGEVLLFLHADTQLPLGFESLVRQALAKPGVVAGAFELQIDAELTGIRLVEIFANWRSRLWGMPYGDQANFLTASTFHAVGKFPDLPIMEDFEMMLRLHELGNIEIVSSKVISSCRLWQKLGVLQTTALNQLITIGYFLKVPPSTLARWYRRDKGV